MYGFEWGNATNCKNSISSNNASNRNKFWKVSISDAVKSMVLFIHDIKDMSKEISESKQRYAKFNIEMKPVVIAVGDDIRNLQYFYVWLADNIYYKFDSFLAAFDCCFKLYLVLKLDYALESEIVWTFVQQHFFNLNLQKDVKSSVLKRFLNNFDKHCSIMNNDGVF